MRSRKHKSDINYRIAVAAVVLVVLLPVLSLALISCGSADTEQSEARPPTQEENAEDLGRIMAHRNQLEGDLNEPVDAVIKGEVTAFADAGEETWILLRVVDFRCSNIPPGTINAAPGSELAIRLRKTEESGSIATGDSLEINAMVSKSKEGPVIIGRAFRADQ